MNLLGRLALTLSLADSSGSIHAKPIDCYILGGIETTQIILSLPDLVTHYVDLFIDLIKSANKHHNAINMISLTNTSKINNSNTSNSYAPDPFNNIIPPSGTQDNKVKQDILQATLSHAIIPNPPATSVPTNCTIHNYCIIVASSLY